MWFDILILIPFLIINTYINNILIVEVELNPSGEDKGNEWVRLYNPNDNDISIEGWQLVSSNHSILLKDIIKGKDYLIITADKRWLNNENEHLRLYDNNNNLIYETPQLSDDKNNYYTWQLIGDTWQFRENIDSQKERSIDALVELLSVIDGDTINVRVIIGQIRDNQLIGNYTLRLADIDAPEISTSEGKESKVFLSSLLNNLTDNNLYLDIDNKYIFDRYNRIVAVVYYKDGDNLVNINKYLVEQGYAKINDYDNEFNPSEFELNNDYNKFNTSAIPEFEYIILILTISIGFIVVSKKIDNSLMH